MGADIHAYVEYRNKNTEDNNKQIYWSSLGRIMLSRYYHFFGLLGNERRGRQVLFKSKGLPNDIGQVAQDDWWISIDEDNVAEYLENPITKEDALKWNEKYGVKIEYIGYKPYRVENPDWHQASLITTEELKKVLTLIKVETKEVYIDGEAVLAMMESLEKNGKIARLVFWFDN